jgi:hypothetical protein
MLRAVVNDQLFCTALRDWIEPFGGASIAFFHDAVAWTIDKPGADKIERAHTSLLASDQPLHQAINICISVQQWIGISIASCADQIEHIFIQWLQSISQ